MKIDMPATQKGIELHFDKDEPMNWSQYSDRPKQYGVALRQGEQVTVTNIVAKNSGGRNYGRKAGLDSIRDGILLLKN